MNRKDDNNRLLTWNYKCSNKKWNECSRKGVKSYDERFVALIVDVRQWKAGRNSCAIYDNSHRLCSLLTRVQHWKKNLKLPTARSSLFWDEWKFCFELKSSFRATRRSLVFQGVCLDRQDGDLWQCSWIRGIFYQQPGSIRSRSWQKQPSARDNWIQGQHP